MWLDGILPGSIRLYSIGRNRLLVENYLCILEISEVCMLISGKDMDVKVTGEALRVSCMLKGEMVIEGAVGQIAFLAKGACV